MTDKVPIISLEDPVVIQDIVIVSKALPRSPVPAGEFGDMRADEPSQAIRLFALIKNIVERTAFKHRLRHCDSQNQLKPDKKNHITRAITNEFFFYTKTPLSIKEFEHLQEKIFKLAQQQPENLYCILSSFAVKTPENTLMNVVVHLECGKKPKIQYIVKNYPSVLDPTYIEKSKDGSVALKNVNARTHDLSNYQMVIDNEKYSFSYDSIVECKTNGGEGFFVSINICQDYLLTVPAKQLGKKIEMMIAQLTQGTRSEPIPTRYSRVITSDVTSLLPEDNSQVTHADPIFSLTDCKPGVGKLKSYAIPVSFGVPAVIMPTNPAICEGLPVHLMKEVTKANQLLVQSSPSGIFTRDQNFPHLPRYQAGQSPQSLLLKSDPVSITEEVGKKRR